MAQIGTPNQWSNLTGVAKERERGQRRKRIVSIVTVVAVMAATAMPAFAIPGNGNDETGQHAGYGLATSENDSEGDDNYSARAVAKDKKGELKGNAYGDYNNW